MAYLSCAKDNEYPLLLIFNLISSIICIRFYLLLKQLICLRLDQTPKRLNHQAEHSPGNMLPGR